MTVTWVEGTAVNDRAKVRQVTAAVDGELIATITRIKGMWYVSSLIGGSGTRNTSLKAAKRYVKMYIAPEAHS